MRMHPYVLATLLFDALLFFKTVQSECSEAEYEKCSKLAQPLIREAYLIFPDNLNDIRLVCNNWNNFIDCLYKYTDKCFTEDQRRQFKKLIEKPLDSVHKMCAQETYQREYLVHAPCLKSLVTSGGRCGPYYDLMIVELDRSDLAAECCAHGRFKQCVLTETERVCDRGIKNGPSYRLCLEIITNAFSATEKNCENYIPNAGDCILTTESIQITSSPSESYPWSTTITREKSSKGLTVFGTVPSRPTTTWLPAAKELPSRPITTWVPPISEPSSKPITTWLPPSKELSFKPITTWQPSPAPTDPIDSDVNNVSLINPKPPSSSRSTYGRASNWTTMDVNNPLESSGTIPTFNREDTTAPQSPPDTSFTWYPAAGSQISNEVDEPNQLGLVKPGGSTAMCSYESFSLALIVVAVLNAILV